MTSNDDDGRIDFNLFIFCLVFAVGQELIYQCGSERGTATVATTATGVPIDNHG